MPAGTRQGRSVAAVGRPLEPRIVAAMRHVERHLDRELSLDELAAAAGLSSYHFHRVFRVMVGEPVMEYARRIRLEHAAYRLRSTRWPVARVALDVGYESADAFGRAFRERFGDSPTGFRRRARSESGGAATPGQPQPPSGVGRAKPRTSDPAPRIIRRAPARLLCVRHLGPYQEVWRAWRRLDAWVAARLPPGSSASRRPRYGLSHDDPDLVPADRLRYDAGLELEASSPGAAWMREVARPEHLIAADGVGNDEVYVREVRGGDYAVVTHTGPYHFLGEAYGRLYAWLAGSGREPADAPPLEHYRNDGGDVGPERLLTDVLLPLR